MTKTTQLKKSRHTQAGRILALTFLTLLTWVVGITPYYGWVAPTLGLVALVINGVIYSWRIQRA